MFGAAMCLGDFVWLGDLALFPQRHSILPSYTFLYIPRSPSFSFGFLFNYSYVPLIPCRLKLSIQLKALSEFFSLLGTYPEPLPLNAYRPPFSPCMAFD